MNGPTRPQKRGQQKRAEKGKKRGHEEKGRKGDIHLFGLVNAHARAALPLLEYGWALADVPADDDPRRHLRVG